MSTNVKAHVARQAIEDVVRLMAAARPHPHQRIAVKFIFRELPGWLDDLAAVTEAVDDIGVSLAYVRGIPVHVDSFLGCEWRVEFDDGSWLNMQQAPTTEGSETTPADPGICPECSGDGSEVVGDGTHGGTEQQACAACGGSGYAVPTTEAPNG